MKSRISNQAPALSTYIELNQKHGYGYQARMVMDGIIDSVIDTEPFTLDEAYSGATLAIEEINKETGYNYDPQKVIRIAGNAIEGNKSRDFTTARVARDIERGRGELTHPAGHDYTIKAIDGKEEELLSGRGVVLVTFLSWRDEKMPKAHEALRRYCEYLALHGYGSGASDMLVELDGMDTERAVSWIKATYGKYVKDNLALLRHVLPGVV